MSDAAAPEPIEALARSAAAGDPRAMGEVGRRLLLGQAAPALPREGARLLADAARLGDPAAAELASVLLAGGFFAPQSWRLALDYLQLAAEAGSQRARAQLALLAAVPPRGAAEDWAGLRARVDVAAWTRPPAVRLLSESPRVLAVSGLAGADACDWIVDAARPRLERAQVKDPRTGLTVMGATRTNRVANFAATDTSVLNLLVQARIAAAAGLDTRMMEAFAVLHYAPGEQASEHFDYLDPDVPAYAEDIARYGQRTATALLYLNDDYEGGETAFPELGLRHRGSKGDALIFFSVDPQGRPDPRTVHAGRPPARGEKWVLSQFVRDRPMAPGS